MHRLILTLFCLVLLSPVTAVAQTETPPEPETQAEPEANAETAEEPKEITEDQEAPDIVKQQQEVLWAPQGGRARRLHLGQAEVRRMDEGRD